MTMTLKSLAAQMRAYRPEADEYKGKHIIPSWADELDAIDAHLSAQDSAWQAIVQHCMVTEAVTPREDDPYGTINDIISWHVNADRLSQGAQNSDSGSFERGFVRGYANGLSAAVAECRRLGHALDDGGNEYVRYSEAIKCAAFIGRLKPPELVPSTEEVAHGAQSSGNSGEVAGVAQGAQVKAFGYVREGSVEAVMEHDFAPLIKKRRTKTHCVPVYTHPAERAAVPDGLVSEPVAMLIAQFAANWGAEHHSWSDQNLDIGAQEWFNAWRSMAEDKAAAPQPPEGARVVDGLDNLTDEQLMEFVAIGLRHAEVKNFRIDDLRPAFKKLKTMLAAPTLAGKEDDLCFGGDEAKCVCARDFGYRVCSKGGA